jgi:hypothetical protein
MLSWILRGMAAGAVGTTALNAASYFDMVLRGRPASRIPEESADRLSTITGVPVPGRGEQREHRLVGLGGLLGIATGIGVGAAYGAAARLGWRPSLPVAALTTGVAAMAAADVPLVAMHLTDPRSWRASDWLSDLLPHVAYGAATAATWAALSRH